MRLLIVNKNDAGQRLDKFLKKSTVGLPDALLYKYLRKKCVKCNGSHATDPGIVLAEGDRIEVYMQDAFFARPEQSFRTLTPRLTLAYEDDHIMVCEKEAGMSCHADRGQQSGTLIDHCKAYLFQSGAYRPEDEHSFAPALANRIDRNTAGLVLCAKDAASLRALCAMIQKKHIRKEYRALVRGCPNPQSGTLKHYLQKDSEKKRVRVFDTPHPGAREALMHYRTLKTENGVSLLEITLETGRTHQIRAQLAHIGCPLLGDAKYAVERGKDTLGFAHQALVAYSLTFFPAAGDEPLLYLAGKRVTVKNLDGRFTYMHV